MALKMLGIRLNPVLMFVRFCLKKGLLLKGVIFGR